MRLVIAEKPSVGRAIAASLGSPQQGHGCLTCVGDTTVTWAYGHLLSQVKPEEYAGGRIDIGNLPIIPDEFRMVPKDADSAKQLKVISDLLGKAKSVVHAGDPDREGQLLIDEILHHAGWSGPTQRLWLSAVDPESVKKAMASLKDNATMADLSASAECRSRADWLVGFNGSIALSRKIQAAGGSEALSLGRVQTPTLALLARREEEVAGFSKRHHYIVSAMIDGGIKAGWRMPSDLEGLSEDGLLLDKRIADATAARIGGKAATVTDYKTAQGQRAAPLPHSLSSLQKAASSRFGMSAKATLAAAQALYESGVTTYPRSDCRYLPAEQHATAGDVLRGLAGLAGADGADAKLKHAAWDSSKITAHHAIVPTGRPAGSLSGDQAKLFGLISSAFITLFHPPETFETRTATFDIDGLVFDGKSRTTIEPGWTKLGGDQDDEDDQPDSNGGRLPDLTKGDRRTCERGQAEARETKPPKPYNDGSLIGAMTSIHRLVDDPKLKARLKETSGLGTEATRAGIIETLVARGYVERKGKEIRATQMGVALIKAVRQVYPPVADPGVTAAWEDQLSNVAAGKLSAADFMSAQIGQVRKMVAAIVGGAAIEGMGPAPSKHPCPACGVNLFDRKSKKGFSFFTCGGTCGGAFFKEKDGKPGSKLGAPGEPREQPAGTGPACPECAKPLIEGVTKNGKPYFRCGSGDGCWWPAKAGEGLGDKWPPMKR